MNIGRVRPVPPCVSLQLIRDWRIAARLLLVILSYGKIVQYTIVTLLHSRGISCACTLGEWMAGNYIRKRPDIIVYASPSKTTRDMDLLKLEYTSKMVGVNTYNGFPGANLKDPFCFE